MTHHIPSAEGQDRVWLADTLTRVAFRYGRALHALSMVPAPLASARLWDLPEADDVQQAAEAIARHVQTAMDELDRLSQYVEAITDPGTAICQTCGANLGHFHGMEGWRHWREEDDPANRPLRNRVLWIPGHDPRPTWPAPPRPDWQDEDTDLAPTTSTPDHTPDRKGSAPS